MRSADPDRRLGASATHAASVAVIRAWIEGDSPHDLRIRIVSVADVSSETHDIGITTDISEACSIIRTWLESFVLDHRAAPK